jgi:hypothetical protein
MRHRASLRDGFGRRRTIVVVAVVALLIAFSTYGTEDSENKGNDTANRENDRPVLRISKAQVLDGSAWSRSFRTPSGPIYLFGGHKSTDCGKTIVLCDKSDPQLGTALNSGNLNSFYSRQGLFIGLYYAVTCDTPGHCVGQMWRSFDDLKTLQRGETTVLIPEAGMVRGETSGFGPGLYFHRGMVVMPDGSLVACMMGNFEQDKIIPLDPRSQAELKYKMRAFVVHSTDQGKVWHYLSTVAAPRFGVVDDTEGFDECTILQLADGRLLVVMRTGNYTPLVASWSSDGGRTWTKPSTPQGLGPGVDPGLLKLSDGRLALAYGQTHPRTGPKKPDYRQEDPRRRCLLAINSDGTGESWVTTTVADYARRSAYPTIYEVEPDVVVYQCDLDLWRIDLQPVRKK